MALEPFFFGLWDGVGVSDAYLYQLLIYLIMSITILIVSRLVPIVHGNLCATFCVWGNFLWS